MPCRQRAKRSQDRSSASDGLQLQLGNTEAAKRELTRGASQRWATGHAGRLIRINHFEDRVEASGQRCGFHSPAEVGTRARGAEPGAPSSARAPRVDTPDQEPAFGKCSRRQMAKTFRASESTHRPREIAAGAASCRMEVTIEGRNSLLEHGGHEQLLAMPRIALGQLSGKQALHT